jgi:hypothetical protein
LRWLDAALADACRRRPDGWRVVLLHHPLYTAISNHCEHPDVAGVRANLQEILWDRVHLVLAGHSHGFEWIESAALPNVCLVVTGGGGQVTLRRPVMHSRRASRRALRQVLADAGMRRYAYFGAGPFARGGGGPPVYHYLRLHVTADRIEITPVGVRPTEDGFERHSPVAVEFYPDLRDASRYHLRRLDHITLTRGAPPVLSWG